MRKNLPSHTTSHIATGTWLVFDTQKEILRLHSNTFGTQTIYYNNEEIGSIRNLKSKFEYNFEKKGHTFSIKMHTESHAKTQNVTTFHKNKSIVRIFKSSFKYSIKQIAIVLIPIILISAVLTLLNTPSTIQYGCVLGWLVVSILLTGKDYLVISESDNPNFD